MGREWIYECDKKGEKQLVGYGESAFYVRKIPRLQAAEVIKKHHYSGKVVATSSPSFGVWIEEKMLGVLQFGPLGNPRCHGHIVADSLFEECRELNRMWLSDLAPRNSESRAISLCMRLMKHLRPRLKWVQSFADERCGRWGVVYQASNFLYLGEHRAKFYEIDGEIFHQKALTIKGHRGWKLLQQGKRAKTFSYRQFRYLYPVDKRIVPRICFPILPYPKPEIGH